MSALPLSHDGDDDDDGATASPARAAAGREIVARLERAAGVYRIDTGGRIDMFWHADFASPDECAAMRALIDDGAYPSTLFPGSEGPDYRSSSSCNLDPDDPLVARLSERIVALMGVAADHGETIQGQRYEPGQQYREHYDWFSPQADYWPAMRRQGGQRCWTAMIYLSAMEKGGETLFPHLNFMVPPREGMMLMWSNLDAHGAPAEASLHAARPVEAGVKYVATKWFRERPWLAEP